MKKILRESEIESKSACHAGRPAIGQPRQTAFYSPERRAGNEFESADTAIITSVRTNHDKETDDYVVLLHGGSFVAGCR